ncbi:MAG TPA: saccharopine dehydrogenase, partial [Anaerolineales bacterium]|nr:saccharopine dehydrogenase [Anaerolineales bacterium]
MKIVVLGGAGKMGSIATQALANDQRVDEIVIGDYNLENAKIVAEYIGSPKITI